MDHISILASSFADELFGKLFVELGPIDYSSIIRLVGVNPLCKGIINQAIRERVTETQLQKTSATAAWAKSKENAVVNLMKVPGRRRKKINAAHALSQIAPLLTGSDLDPEYDCDRTLRSERRKRSLSSSDSSAVFIKNANRRAGKGKAGFG